MSKFIVVATIFMFVFPCATCAQEVSSLPKETEDRTYQPEVEFFVDWSVAKKSIWETGIRRTQKCRKDYVDSQVES